MRAGGRALTKALWCGVLLGIVALNADGQYEQWRLWAVGLFGAGFTAWLTAAAVSIMLNDVASSREAQPAASSSGRLDT